jgi:hypothetical protein
VRKDHRNTRGPGRAAALLAVLAALALAATGLAQVPLRPGGPPPPGPLRVFLDWPGADLEPFRGELTFAILVASREEADVRVLVAPAADGTEALTLSFTGLGRFAGDDNAMTYRPGPGEKPGEVRENVARLTKIGLLRYVAKTPAARDVTVEFQDQVRPTSVVDKWDFWVFNLGLDQFMMGESQYSSTSSSGSFSANRVTPELKVRTSVYGNLSRQRFDVEGVSYKSETHGAGFEGLVVKSLGDHWSAGAYLSMNSSTYSNIKFAVTPAPAVEYNVFPYAESTRRQFRFLYKFGYTYAVFHEVTIYDKTRQGLFHESLSATLELKQPWGTAEVGLEGSHYFFKPFKYRVELSAEVSLRVWKGLSFTVDGQFAKIHDQIYLPKQGATPEEILLMLRELETDFEYYVSVGVNFRFGSLKSNVVNPRFGSGSRNISISF